MAMAAIGATSQSSVILSASQPGSTEILRCTSLRFDRNRNLYTWDGTVDELQEFCVDNLELLEPKLSSSERCISLKTKGVTFTLYPSTKTLQVQGMDQKEVKRKMQVFLPTDQGNQSENSELSTDVEDVISRVTGHLATREFRHLLTRHQETTSPPTNSKSPRHQTLE